MSDFNYFVLLGVILGTGALTATEDTDIARCAAFMVFFLVLAMTVGFADG